MKLLKNDGKRCAFQIGKRERETLFAVLKLYPILKTACRNPSQPDSKPLLDEKLLNEALAEQRAENKKQVEALLKDETHFEQTSVGFKWSLLPSQVECLLQVLNDIRIGSWLALGAPDKNKEFHLKLTEKSLRHLWAMEICGLFEQDFLMGLHGRPSPSEE